ncbi:MAG TPA: hypothetical protein VKY37_06790, partial [Brumimicrobium sp.]|nr:hypothetical protein [Brumimicrobium sp.]
SIKKYKKSLRLGVYSRKKQGISNINLIKLKIINQLKILYVRTLFFLGKENVYFKKIGREPTEIELEQHNKLITPTI